MSACRHTLHRRRGVSLVEALVALAVMAFGMLALVGVQATMRLNSDLAKQRSEATRIASEEIENLRSFSSVPVVAGQPNTSYDEIASRTVEGYQPPGGIGNTTYRVVRTVTPVPGSQQKAVTVQVQWNDRTNVQQTVTLDSVLSGTPPNLGALLALAPQASPVSLRGGRHVTIPLDAVDQGDGTSRFVPPGAVDLTWYFNNLSGEMTVPCGNEGHRCPASLVSGRVYFHLSGTPSAEQPQGPAHDLRDAPNALTMSGALNVSSDPPPQCYAAQATSDPFVVYYCAVRPQTSKGWGGVLSPAPVLADGTLMSFGGTPPPYRSCRFTVAVDNLLTTEVDEGNFAANEDHPRTYCMEKPGTGAGTPPCTGRPVIGNLINQHFLVISGSQSCPSSTRPHQPYPA